MLISVTTLMASLPIAAQAQGEQPLDLSTLTPTTEGNHDELLIGYGDQGWVYQIVNFGGTAISNGTSFNGTITGTMSSDKARPARFISIEGKKIITLKDVTVEHNPNIVTHQNWAVSTGVDLTFLVNGTKSSVINASSIMNQGTLALIINEQSLDIQQGGINNWGDLTISTSPDKRLSVKNTTDNAIGIQQGGGSINLNGNIHAMGKQIGIAIEGGEIIANGAGITAQAEMIALSLGPTYNPQAIQFFYDAPPTDGQTLSITPADGSTPYASFTTDRISKSFGILAQQGAAYSATLGDKRQYSTKENENGSVARNRAFFPGGMDSQKSTQYHGLTSTRPASESLNLAAQHIQEAPILRYETDSEWTCDGELFNGTLSEISDISRNLTIRAAGSPTLTLLRAYITAPDGKTALTVASGEVTLESASTSQLQGTYGLRVEAGARCLVTPSHDLNATLAFVGEQAAIDTDGGGIVDGLTELTWTATTKGVYLYDGQYITQIINAPMKSTAVNANFPFRAKSIATSLWQEGYLSTDAGTTYTDQFAAAPATGVTRYLGLREIPEPTVIINTAVTFDTNLHDNKDIIVTKDGILTVNTDSRVKNLTLEEGGQVRTDVENTPVNLRLEEKLILAYPDRNQWKASSIVGKPNDLRTRGGGNHAFHHLSGYTAADKQKWEALSRDLENDSPILLAGDGLPLDTLEIHSEGTGADKTIRLNTPLPESPATTLNTGVFLFRANLRLHDTEMENIYVLSDDGSRFELRDKVTLRPAESYVVANAATQSMLKSLRLDGVVTGTDTPAVATDDSLRAWAADGRLHLSADHAEKVAVYHISGTLRCYLPLLRGETTIALPSGIYLVRQGGTTIKVVL